VRVALIAVGISGFAALAYEVIWTRALLRYLFNSTYAFTTMLGAFLAGIAIGSWLYQWLPGRKSHPLLLFAAIEAAVGLGFAISSATFANLPALSELLTGGSAISSFREATLGMFARASLILLPPAICLGAAIPAAAEICTRRADRVGGSIARVYATNTLGSVLGSIAATFVLIPLFGMHGSLLVLIGLNAAMAASLAAVAPMAPRARWAALAACGALVLAAVAWVPPDLFQRSFAPAGSRLLYYEEGATDTVGVGEHAGHRTMLYDDQRGTASTSSYAGNFFLGHLPMLLHPGEPQLALHICFGVGNSLSAMASHDSLERVDSVELSPNVTGAAGFFWTNDRVLENPKVRSIADDGRNFVMASRERYDVIALEPPEPFTAGVINLFSREFYQDALERLADDGVMLQWIPVGLAPLDEERQLFRAFSDVFPHVTAWQQLNQHGPILLVGTRQPLEIDLQRLKRKMSAKRVRQDLALGGIRDVYRLLATFVYDADGFAAFVDGVEPVTDDRTTLDFSIPRYIGSGFGLGWGVQAVADGRTPITAIVGRKEFYDSEKRSVMPYLTNLGDTTTAQVAERIRRHLEPGFGPTPSLVGRRGWARMRRNL
jgi:spermidine synthase